MFLKLPTLKMDAATEGNTNGTGTPQTPPATPPQTPPAQAAGNTVDDYGYPIEAPAAKPEEKKEATPPAAKPEEKKADDVKVKIPGYDDAPPATPPATPPAAKPEEKKADDPPATDLGYKIEVADLHADEIKIVEDLAKTHKLTKEQAVAVAEMRKLDIQALTKIEADAIETKKTQVAKLRSDWKNELVNDKSFGGTNFDTSMQQAGTVLDKFFPETKKMLDERKGMLPPSTMRDLQALHKTLFATEALVEGDKVADKKSGNSWDDFYN
jgi:hypothetical protein